MFRVAVFLVGSPFAQVCVVPFLVGARWAVAGSRWPMDFASITLVAGKWALISANLSLVRAWWRKGTAWCSLRSR